MQEYYRFLMPRLNGEEIGRNFGHYRSLVRKGVAGFIVFGGRLAKVRKHVYLLQKEAELPLIIASDLERGLGQQIKGGTSFPPAMALAKAALKKHDHGAAFDLSMFRRACSAVAEEAAYTGINTIFAPVLDINTNPKNPIIATRAFGEEAETVSLLGCEMVKTFQGHGIAACGKHFPGHGDTEADSHISLPVIRRGLSELKKIELTPFREAIAAGVKMIMLGHLSVPALDPTGIPVTLSGKAVEFLRKKMGYNGIVITDAMNMGGIGRYSEEEASLMALAAGADVILHPSDADKVASYLGTRKTRFEAGRLEEFRRCLPCLPEKERPDFRKNSVLSESLTEKALTLSGAFRLEGRSCLVILNDEDDERGALFANRLKKGLRGLKIMRVNLSSRESLLTLPEGAQIIVAIFSETRGWKGGAGDWLYKALSGLAGRADLYISFGSPYLLDRVEGAAKLFAYWDSAAAQEAVAGLLIKKIR
ncbi:MAG: glycoside hydrolase family 3 N-terminal domain-containing protein [Acidobacteriota bacterium]